jgi:hypothetical protein
VTIEFIFVLLASNDRVFIRGSEVDGSIELIVKRSRKGKVDRYFCHWSRGGNNVTPDSRY